MNFFYLQPGKGLNDVQKMVVEKSEQLDIKEIDQILTILNGRKKDLETVFELLVLYLSRINISFFPCDRKLEFHKMNYSKNSLRK